MSSTLISRIRKDTIMTQFNDFVKDARIKSGVILRLFCQENNFDPSYISKLERGVTPVPDDLEFLNKYAKALKLEGIDVVKFYDIAEEDKGKIYRVIDDNEALRLIAPLLLHKKLNKDQISKLVEEIKNI